MLGKPCPKFFQGCVIKLQVQQFLQHHFLHCFVPQGLPGTIVDQLHSPAQLLRADLRKVRSFREKES